jgi:hypothetical protein
MRTITIEPLPENLADLSNTQRAQLTNAREARLRKIFNQNLDDVTEVEANEAKRLNDELEFIRGAGPEPLKMAHPTGGLAAGGGGEFSQAIRRAGWDPVSKSKVTLGVGTGLLQGLTWSDSPSDIAAPRRVSLSVLGADRRYIYPSLKIVGVSATDTSVDYVRQTSRSLAAPSDMVRGLDAVTDKPETSLVAGLESAQLAQVAHVIPAVPNIIARQTDFGQLIDNELRLGLSEALDYQVVTAITGASVPVGGGGTNRAEDIRMAMTTVEAAGYLPDTVALPPSFAEELDILSLTLFNSTGLKPNFGLNVRISKSLAVPVVYDSSAFATLYLGPTEFQSFEENFGQTNSQLYRGEVNAVAVVDRADAACKVYAS